jgi:hypothetical protein
MGRVRGAMLGSGESSPIENVGSYASLAISLMTMASSSLVNPWATWRATRSSGSSSDGSPVDTL